MAVVYYQTEGGRQEEEQPVYDIQAQRERQEEAAGDCVEAAETAV